MTDAVIGMVVEDVKDVVIGIAVPNMEDIVIATALQNMKDAVARHGCCCSRDEESVKDPGLQRDRPFKQAWHCP